MTSRAQCGQSLLNALFDTAADDEVVGVEPLQRVDCAVLLQRAEGIVAAGTVLHEAEVSIAQHGQVVRAVVRAFGQSLQFGRGFSVVEQAVLKRGQR